MTGYGHAISREVDGTVWVCEIHSVNRRHLDLVLSLPPTLLYLDVSLRKQFSTEMSRGTVTVRVTPQVRKGELQVVAGLKALKEKWVDAAYALGYGPESIDLPFLLSRLEARTETEQPPLSKESEELLHQTIEKALSSFLKMRMKEGRELAADIRKRLKEIAALIREIEGDTPHSSTAYRKKLLDRIEDVVEGASEDDRILREVALYAERVDVTEEVVRLKSHLKQFEETMRDKEKSVGRTLDFLAQEMLRETNTIGSKAQELAIARRVIKIKADLEKIREQVQNIE